MKIGISIGCLVNVPTLISPRMLNELAQRLVYKGFFLQSLPLKGAIGDDFPDGPFFETAWPAIRDGRYVGATHKDKILFPDPDTVLAWEARRRYAGAIEVVHDLDSQSKAAIEVHKGNWQELPVFLEKNPHRLLCIDTCHWRAMPENPSLSEFLKQYGDRVALLHFQPLRWSNEWSQFLRKERTELEDMLRLALTYCPDVDVVVEASPLIHGKGLSLAAISARALMGRLEWTLERVGQIARYERLIR